MFGSVDIKSRPLKLVYLVDPNKANQVREAIRLSSTLWGGEYFPIISIYKKMPATWREKPFKTPLAKSVILGYIEAFDPDVLVQLSKEVPQYINDLGLEIIKPDKIWKVLDRNRSLSPQFGLGIFELLNEIFDQYFKFKMKYPLKILFPRIPKQYSLFWSSFVGEIPLSIISHLEKNYFEPLEVMTPIAGIENLKNILSKNILYPLKITRHGIKNYTRHGSSRDAYIYFMDATKTEDVVDFWNLRATGKKVLPVPKQLKANPQIKEIVINFLKKHYRPFAHNPGIYDMATILRARNCTIDEVNDFAETLKIEQDPGDCSTTKSFMIQHWYPRMWDERARDKDHAIPVDTYGEEENSTEIVENKELRISFRPLLPKFANKYSFHGAPRCANEISFRFYASDEYVVKAFPKLSGENFIKAISSLGSFRGDWRVGRNGLVKLVKNNIIEIREIPLAEKVFFAWLKDLGWEPAISSAGLLAKQIHKNLNGFLRHLKNEKLLCLFEHMNGGSVKLNGSPIENNKINQERELAVGVVKERLKNISSWNGLHDYLIKHDVFKLGVRIQCPRCSRNSWYTLDSIREILSCPRCLNNFSAIGNIDNSKWYYKTAGPFSVPNYADGAYTVLLTIDFFDSPTTDANQITPVLSFKVETPDKKNIEVDFAGFWQESACGEIKDSIIFGECKTFGRFKKHEFDKMKYLAKTFPGSILVFSTLCKSLTKKEIAGISRIAKKGRKYWKAERPINPVLILTGNELCSQLGPPYCWADPFKEIFAHIFGMIEMCDATQQIYLNLPSWQTEWQKKWEKKKHLRNESKQS